MELPSDNPGGRVTGMWDRGGKLFSSCYCNFYVVVEGLVGKGTFLIKGFDYAPQS